jgi:hypothetical protein
MARFPSALPSCPKGEFPQFPLVRHPPNGFAPKASGGGML